MTTQRPHCLSQQAVDGCETPAFIVDLDRLRSNLQSLRLFAHEAECTALYSVKALTLADVLVAASRALDGLSVSSLFEARFASQFVDSHQCLSFVSPLLSAGDATEVASLCSRVTLNSLTQLERLGDVLLGECEVGLRINPELSWVSDLRSDPCRVDSHLGVPLSDVVAMMGQRSDRLQGISGLHLHNNRHSRNGRQLITTIDRLVNALGDRLAEFRWLNLGGGYDFGNLSDSSDVIHKLRELRSRFKLEIIIEPGAAVTQSAGYFVTSVADLVHRPDKPLGIVDFSLNHWPELFEYQIRPEIIDATQAGPFAYRLAGCSCLAGDVLGEYTFDKQLQLGDRLVLASAGAYSIGKAHPFNGIPLPRVYSFSEQDGLRLLNDYDYPDFVTRCGDNQSLPC